MISHPTVNPEECLSAARRAMLLEASAIQAAAERLDGNLTRAVELLAQHNGKIVVTGVGKSGLIGQKIAATLCSTGTPAIFLHAAEAVHGWACTPPATPPCSSPRAALRWSWCG